MQVISNLKAVGVAAVMGAATVANAGFFTQTSTTNFLPTSAEVVPAGTTGINWRAFDSNFSVFQVVAGGSQISISPTPAFYFNPVAVFAFNDQGRGVLGYNGIVANDFTFNIPTTAGQTYFLAFSHWGLEPANNLNSIFSASNFGVNNPLNNNVFNNTAGDNQFGEEDHSFDIQGLAVPTPGSVALLAMAGLVAARRRR